MGVLSNVCCLAGVAKLTRPIHRKRNSSNDAFNCTQKVDACTEDERGTTSHVPSEVLGSNTSNSLMPQTLATIVFVFLLVSSVLGSLWLAAPVLIVAIILVTVLSHKVLQARPLKANGRLTAANDSAFKTEAGPCPTEMTELVRAEFVDGSAHWVTVQDSERQLRAAAGDAAVAMQQLRTSIVWRKDVFAEWLETNGASVSETEFRVIALGHEKRPLLYFCSVHQAPGDVTAKQLACAIERAVQQYCTGEQQQVDIIFDCHGFRPWLDSNVGAWMKLSGAFPSYFAERIHRIVVLDFSVIAGTFWRACKPVLPAKTVQKIGFARRSRCEEMQGIWDLCASPDIREMVDSLLTLNLSTAVQNDRDSTITGRDHSHRLTNAFLQTQTTAHKML